MPKKVKLQRKFESQGGIQEFDAASEKEKTTSAKEKEKRQQEKVQEVAISRGDEESSKEEGILAKAPISEPTQETRVATPANASPEVEIGQAQKTKTREEETSSTTTYPPTKGDKIQEEEKTAKLSSQADQDGEREKRGKGYQKMSIHQQLGM